MGSAIKDTVTRLNINMRLNLFNLLAGLFFLHIVVPPFGDILKILGMPLFRHAFKIPLVLTFLICFLWNVSNKRITIFFESGLVLFFLFPALIIGLLENPVGWATLSDLYSAALPLVAMPVGYYLAKRYGSQMDAMMETTIFRSFYLLCVAVFIYFLLYQVGIVKRLGFSAPIILISPYFLVFKRYRLFVACIVLTLLTGKRSAMALLAVQVAFFFLYALKKPTMRNILSAFSILVAMCLIIGLVYKYSPDLLKRYKSIEQIDIHSAKSLGVATSGRYYEAISVIKHLNKNKYLWLFGGGMGEVYGYFNPIKNTVEVRHFSHFSFFAYTLVFGAIFSVLLYVSIFLTFIKGLPKLNNNYFFLVFTMYFLASFVGATIFVDPFFWVFLGSVKYLTKLNTETLQKCPKVGRIQLQSPIHYNPCGPNPTIL